MRAHETEARRLAHVLCGGDGDDAVQAAIVKAWYSIGRYREAASFRTWLLRIVANEAHNQRRSAGRRMHYELRLVEERVAPSPESVVVDGESQRALLAAVAALPIKLRDVVSCRHLLDLSEAETAAVLAIPAGTVKSRLSRGLDHLRDMLEVEHG